MMYHTIRRSDMLYRAISSFRLITSALILMLSFNVLEAQSIRYGKITGTITDETGQPVPGVQLQLTSEALISGKKLTTTQANGSYAFLNLPVGTYGVEASLEG